jgi:hypothetical protein
MLEYLEKLFLEREISTFNAKDNRIICFSHAINLAVQDVLKEMSSVEAPENDDDDDFEDLADAANTKEARGIAQSFENACAEDPISRVRKIVMAIRASGQRREALTTWIENGNRNGLFVLQNAPVEIEPMQLLRDVRTRWDSSYQMITRCIEMQLVSLHSIWTIILLIPLLRQSIPSWHDQEVISNI